MKRLYKCSWCKFLKPFKKEAGKCTGIGDGSIWHSFKCFWAKEDL